MLYKPTNWAQKVIICLEPLEIRSFYLFCFRFIGFRGKKHQLK